jgi:hypothetical protein
VSAIVGRCLQCGGIVLDEDYEIFCLMCGRRFREDEPALRSLRSSPRPGSVGSDHVGDGRRRRPSHAREGLE